MDNSPHSTEGRAPLPRSFWQRLVEPSPHIQDVETRRQARLLASLLLILFPLLAIGNIASRLSGNEPFGAVVQTAAALGAAVQVKEILTEIQRGVNTAVMLTEEGMKGADSGVRVAGLAGTALQRLAESVQESAQAAIQIAAAAGQQETGMEQIAQAMANIHQVMSQSLAGVGQVERAAAQLNGLAGGLRKQVEPYEL